MFRRIVVPSDLTERNRSAVRMASRLVDLDAGVVHLLHVIETIPGLDATEEDEFYTRLEQAARKHLETLGEVLTDAKVNWMMVVVRGSRAKSIVEEAERLEADLIIVQSHSVEERSGGWGTLSYQIGVFAQCPVLLVK